MLRTSWGNSYIPVYCFTVRFTCAEKKFCSNNKKSIATLSFEPGHSTKMQDSVIIAMSFYQIGIFQLVLSLLFSLVSVISHQHPEIVCAMLLLRCKSDRMCNNNSNYTNGIATAWHLLNNDVQFFSRNCSFCFDKTWIDWFDKLHMRKQTITHFYLRISFPRIWTIAMILYFKVQLA